MLRPLSIFAALLGAACVGTPQPEPALRPIDTSRVSLSAVVEGRTTVVGQPGAAQRRGVVLVRTSEGLQVEVEASPVGAFVASIEAAAREELALSQRTALGTSAASAVLVPAGAEGSIEPLDVEEVTITAPDRFGLVTISASPGATEPGATVVASNVTDPAANQVGVEGDGGFLLDLPGLGGHQVALFVTDDDAPDRASQPLLTSVPGLSPPEEDCSNGEDDDGDSLVDCADPDCALECRGAEDCLNGEDDDGDGLSDCDDPDCDDLCRCPEDYTFCDGQCADLMNDSNHCNECGRVCPEETPFCREGSCVRTR